MTVLLAGALSATPAYAQSSGGGAQAPSGQTQQSDGQNQTSTSQSGQTSGSPSPDTGGAAYGQPDPAIPEITVPGMVAKVVHGIAEAPADAPPAVQAAIWAANALIGKPYIYGGGHQAFAASGYDCSGTVSYALHGGMLLGSPMDSTEFERWGLAGRGDWITVFANAGHAYMNIAGIRLDTSSAGDPSGKQGPRWRPLRRSNAGYRVRHPIGF